MGAHAQGYLHALPTAGTILRRIRRVGRFHSLTGACCLVRENRQEVAPPGIVNAFVQTALLAGSVVLVVALLILLWGGTAAQVGRLDRRDVDRVVGTHQSERRLMVEVVALPAHVLMLLGALVRSLGASFAPFLAVGDALLGLLQRPLSFAVVPWVLYQSPVFRDEKDLQPHVDAGLPSREGE